MIQIDGSFGEGGGQILRYALAFSSLVGTPVRINNIRSKRKNPGLGIQHIACIEAFCKWGARATDVFIGSACVDFFPCALKKKNIIVDIPTAGSATLVVQSMILPMSFAAGRVSLEITGGTDVPMAIPYDIFRNVILPQYVKFTDGAKSTLTKRGYYPSGGGHVELSVIPRIIRGAFSAFTDFRTELRAKYLPLDLGQRDIALVIHGIAHASSDLEPAHVAERMALAAKQALGKTSVPVKIQTEYGKTSSTGCGISLWAVVSKSLTSEETSFMGSDALGEKGVAAEIVGAGAAGKLLSLIKNKYSVDVNSADSVIPLLALFGGRMIVPEITDHMKSVAYLVSAFDIAKIDIDEKMKIIRVQRA